MRKTRMSSDLFKTLEAKRCSSNKKWITIAFEAADVGQRLIIAYEVYTISDDGERKRKRFPIETSKHEIVMKDLAIGMGYKFMVQAEYCDNNFSCSVETNYVEGASQALSSDQPGESHGVVDEAKRKPKMKSTTDTYVYYMGDRIKEGKEVYRGTFSYIFERSESSLPPRNVAIKILSASEYEIREQREGNENATAQTTKRMVREAKHMLELIHHPHVVQYIHSCPSEYKDSNLFYIFMELCSEDTLADRIGKLQQYCELEDETYRKGIIVHLTLAVDYMHSHRIYHRDIKPSNILFAKENRVAKISDFGFSKKVKPCDGMISSTVTAGTDGYRPPESYDESRKGKISDRSDVFSLGLVFFYILTKGKHPFGTEAIHQQSNIVDDDKPPIVEGLVGLDAALAKDLIQKMINKTEDERPNMKEIMKHPYFWSVQTIIGFYIKVHDSLSDGEDNATVVDQKDIIKQVKEFFCAASAGAQAIKTNSQPESQTARSVANNMLTKCFEEKHMKPYIEMVCHILDEPRSTPTATLECVEQQVKWFFLAAWCAADVAVRSDGMIPAERHKRVVEDQRFREKKMLSTPYFEKLHKNVQVYIEKFHDVLCYLDNRASHDSAEAEESDVSSDTQSGDDETLKIDTLFENSSDETSEKDDIPPTVRSISTSSDKLYKGFWEEVPMPLKATASNDVRVSDIVALLKNMKTPSGDEYKCNMLANLSHMPLTIGQLISVIDSFDSVIIQHFPVQAENDVKNGAELQRSACVVTSCHLPLESEFICDADKGRFKEVHDNLMEAIRSREKNLDCIRDKAKEFKRIYQKLTNEETVDPKIDRKSPNRSDSRFTKQLEELNSLKIFRQEIRGTDWKEFEGLVEKLHNEPVTGPDQCLLKDILFNISKLYDAAIKGSSKTWKQCFNAVGQRHKCDDCSFVQLVKCAKGCRNDIFGLLAFIRNKLVHFENERTKRHGVWMKEQEHILECVASAVPELLPHMVKVMKDKDDVKTFIERNKLVNGTFLLPLVTEKPHGQPSSDIVGVDPEKKENSARPSH